MITPAEFKILISDDSILARKKIRDCLEMFGYSNVIEAADGLEAIELFKEHQPHLVFMDVVMPKSYGLEALISIKALAPYVTVVMLSSVGTKTNITDSIKHGADDFLVKPFTSSQILTILEKINPN